MNPARHLLAAGLVATAALGVHAQDSTTPRQATPMPETTTQAPAPVVRHTPRTAQAQPIVPNPDGSLPRSLHTNEYRDSYPVTRTPKAPASASHIPTTNPLTSLSSQSGATTPRQPAVVKPAVPVQAAKPRITPAPTVATAPQKPKPVSASATAMAAAAKPKASAATAATGTALLAAAQIPPGPFNRNVVVIDPSHGGNDVGSRITESIFEKDVDLQFAFKLRSLLTARGFTVILTRDSDTASLPDKPDSQLTLDVRAGLANKQQPVACLLLHATGSGHGAHLYTSELNPVPAEPYAAPWLTAQNGWISQSLLLQKQIGRALTRASVPLVLSRASVRPVDSLTCPALVIELAPESDAASSINNDGYQQKVAGAISTALIFWQNSAQPPARLTPPVYKAPPPVVKPEAQTATPATSTPAPIPIPAVQP